MSGEWPDGWASATLATAGLPVTDFTRKSLQAWQHSTPMLPYTNNPIGMPAVRGRTSELMNTGYAMFISMPAFRDAFAEFIKSPVGRTVREALSLDEKFSQVYRAVSGLGWPASKTETDYPSAVLDLTSATYRDSVQTVSDSSNRKTSGVIGSQTAFGTLENVAGRSSARAADAINQATKAIQNTPGRLR